MLSKLSETEKGRSGKKSKRPAAERIKTTLTPEQKLEIATTELEELHKETKEAAKSSEQLLESLRAVLEETDIRIAELKKEAYEFKRDIVVGAENFRTGALCGPGELGAAVWLTRRATCPLPPPPQARPWRRRSSGTWRTS